ncbi:MAG: DUF4351 domain-containing protein, partial [Magnetococcales bacterium]|nr:DUF4351 domain-containing protein [Magnetococcales bacterium]
TWLHCLLTACLAEIKMTESLNDDALMQILIYDHLYLKSAQLERHQLRSVIISSITPRKEFLVRHSCRPVGPVGVHEYIPSCSGAVRLIFLNELTDEPQNAPLKCFASRHNEQKKAFETISHAGLFKLSVAFGQIVAGLWRLQMKSDLNSPEMEEITPEYVKQLGKEWFQSMMDATPEEELFSLPKLEHRLVQERRDSRQEGQAAMLTSLLQRRFGSVPDWANKKITKANLSSLEKWSLRIFDAQSLDDVFSERPIR